MATTGIRFDDDSGLYATNCFPVRSIFGPGFDGGGAWLISHHAEQRRRFKAILCTKPRTYSQIREERKKCERLGTTLDAQKFEEVDDVPILDGFYLMKHCCVEDPSDVCSINISGKELTEVKDEDMTLFDNVAYVNAGENYLPFEAFRGFPNIRELEMPLNGLRSLKLNVTDFPTLELLDLSYNNLSVDDVMTVGLLQNLKVLHLTGNSFKSLPTDMSMPYIPDPKQKIRYQRFPQLEVLMLDDNQLSDVNVFAALAGLQRLHHLNMEKNQIVYVPQLKSIEGKVITHEVKNPERKSKSSSRNSKRSKSNTSIGTPPQKPLTKAVTDLGLSSTGLSSTKIDPEGEKQTVPAEQEVSKAEDVGDPDAANDEQKLPDTLTSEEKDLLTEDLSLNIGDLTDRINEMKAEEGGLTADGLPAVEEKQHELSHCPFPELRYISLAHNQICDEEALLAVAAWPMLVELVIHNNPLTTTHTGDPPLLKRFLHDRLGIKFHRKETKAVIKPHVEVHQKKHRMVSSIVPKVPKPSIEDRLMLEAPPKPPTIIEKLSQGERTLSGLDKPLPPISSQTPERGRPSPHIDSGDDESKYNQFKNKADENDEDAFFMTQVDDQQEEMEVPTEKKKVPTERRKRKKKHREDFEHGDEKYYGYELLLDIDPDDDDVEESKDIQGNIRALKYALGHERVYRDPDVHLDKLSKPVKEYRRVPVPPCEPASKLHKVNTALESLRSRTTLDEASLKDVLKDHSKLKSRFPEAPGLLLQIQRRYNVVRVNSIKSARDSRKRVQTTIEEVEQMTHRKV